jgi:hypothetical protein
MMNKLRYGVFLALCFATTGFAKGIPLSEDEKSAKRVVSMVCDLPVGCGVPVFDDELGVLLLEKAASVDSLVESFSKACTGFTAQPEKPYFKPNDYVASLPLVARYGDDLYRLYKGDNGTAILIFRHKFKGKPLIECFAMGYVAPGSVSPLRLLVAVQDKFGFPTYDWVRGERAYFKGSQEHDIPVIRTYADPIRTARLISVSTVVKMDSE